MSCVAEVERTARPSDLAAVVQEVDSVVRMVAMASVEVVAAAVEMLRCWTERAAVPDHLCPGYP